MFKIALIGDISDKSMGEFFLNKLSDFFTVTYISEDNLIQKGTGEDLLLFDLNKIFSSGMEDLIIVIKNSGTIQIQNQSNDKAIAIISSENQNNLKILSKLNITTITCGASSKDTVTFSSKNDEELVISLQRTISNLKKDIIEPLEVPIKKSVYDDDYKLLAYIALCIEIGIIDKNWH